MRKNIFLVSAFATIFFVTSCSLKRGYVLLQSKPNEIIVTPIIKEYLKKHPNPAIVLKVPKSEEKSTQSDQNSNIYNAIEKELLLSGFKVRDRGLFNEVINKSKEVNYEDIKKLTATDLILELVQLSTKVEYGTNVYYKKSGAKKISKDFTIKKYGAFIEFKRILIENNQYAGSYTFNYTPCDKVDKDNCACAVAYKTVPDKIYPFINFCSSHESSNYRAFEYVSEDVMENFVKNGVKQMLEEIRK
ncbi:MAG: hypothetical protein HS118_10370 [Bacteroidia bacterium]|nr:hypothetical protein [Bacteroidia bacterium]